MRYEFRGLIFAGAYTWRGFIFSEFYSVPILLAHAIIIIIIITIRAALAELNLWLSSLPDLSSCQELAGA